MASQRLFFRHSQAKCGPFAHQDPLDLSKRFPASVLGNFLSAKFVIYNVNFQFPGFQMGPLIQQVQKSKNNVFLTFGFLARCWRLFFQTLSGQADSWIPRGSFFRHSCVMLTYGFPDALFSDTHRRYADLWLPRGSFFRHSQALCRFMASQRLFWSDRNINKQNAFE